MAKEFHWISYAPVAVSSEAQGTTIHALSNSDQPNENSWECGRFAQFPQEIVIRLDHRIELSHLLVAAKVDRHVPRLEIQVGDGLYGSFLDAEYHHAGQAEAINSQYKQVPCIGMGSFLKLIIPRRPAISPQNPHGQVSLAILRVWGRILSYNNIINEINPVKTHTDKVDKILMELGVPLELLLWSKEDHDSYKYAPVDEEARETLLELDLRKNQAYEQEDYGTLQQLTKDIKRLFDIGSEILQLKRDLAYAIAQEDFETAKKLRDRILALQKQHDSIDAMYETKRYERLIILGKPSDAHMAFVNRLLEEERLRAEMLRRMREEELEKHRRYLEELERQRRLDELRNKRDIAPAPKRVVKRQEPEPKLENDPYEYNEGDLDLEPYFRPKINEAGGKVLVADFDLLKRADYRKILRVVGVRLWSAIYSENWRHREAAVRAMLEFCEAPLLPKYQEDTRTLFRAAIDIATIACEDRVLSIYLYGLKVLVTAMSPPICDNKVTPKMVNDAMRIFIPILIAKISELNYRARDISMHTLIELFRHPHIRVGPLIDYIMNVTAPTEPPVEKQAWRVILSRLEIILHVIQEFGINSSEWNWKEVFHNLIIPCLGHANADIRSTCVDIVIALYQKIGMELRLEVDGVGKRIKPQLSQQIYKKMLDIDQKGQQSMPVIDETQEWAEQTPPGTANKKSFNWNRLKDMITDFAEESRKS